MTGKKRSSKKKTAKKTANKTTRKSGSGKKTVRRKKGPAPARWRRVIGTLWRYGRWPLLFGIAALALYLSILDRRITAQFEGRRWEVPARVFAQPLELYATKNITAAGLRGHLRSLGYREDDRLEQPGHFRERGNEITLRTRPFVFWDSAQSDELVRVAFRDGRIDQVRDAQGDDKVLVRLDPLMIGSIVPGTHEDRIVLPPGAVPERLRAALVAVEDRDYYSHHGIDLSAIARAAVANARAGRVVQGGSTLTQQLVKNYFLTNAQKFERKIVEAFMAILLDARYSKRELINGYINEVFLGQDGSRAVHGFALGSQFYFGVPLAELDDARIALLVAIIRGPSYYDPRRHPARALERRDHVLGVLGAEGVMSAQEVAAARAQPLGVVARPGRVRGASPAFMDAVREQLRRDYAPEDLNSAGLRIFTTLDTFVQAEAETICASELAHVETDTDAEAGSLQVGAVITDPQSGELLAAVGGREPAFAGFNRAITLRRPIGSLVKPFVYLSAIASGQYTLATVVPNEPLEVTLENGDVWAPQNYSPVDLGDLPIYRALAESINLPAVHVGLAVGIEQVAQQIEAALPTLEVNRYPSLTLGALNLSPLQVAQMYATLASGGYVTPLRSVREVVTADGAPLNRYDLRVRGSADLTAVAQINAAMEVVMTNGTGRRAGGIVPPSLQLAGKSGSSNDYRDGWFAGFSSDRLAVVWVGRDDNTPMGLSGARSALPVWAQLMAAVASVPVQTLHSEDLVDVPLDYASGMLAGDGCDGAVLLPLPRTADVPPLAPCANDVPDSEDPDSTNNGLLQWLRDRLGGD
ncbi:MAG: penicillin-binding protein 1B [Gammaproteobacteria bacterium]